MSIAIIDVVALLYGVLFANILIAFFVVGVVA